MKRQTYWVSYLFISFVDTGMIKTN